MMKSKEIDVAVIVDLLKTFVTIFETSTISGLFRAISELQNFAGNA